MYTSLLLPLSLPQKLNNHISLITAIKTYSNDKFFTEIKQLKKKRSHLKNILWAPFYGQTNFKIKFLKKVVGLELTFNNVFAKSLKWISEKDGIAGKAHVYLNLTPGMAPNYKMISNNL